jgi:hypothetical protein
MRTRQLRPCLRNSCGPRSLGRCGSCRLLLPAHPWAATSLSRARCPARPQPAGVTGLIAEARIGPFIVRPATGVLPGRGLRLPCTQTVSITFAPTEPEVFEGERCCLLETARYFGLGVLGTRPCRRTLLLPDCVGGTCCVVCGPSEVAASRVADAASPAHRPLPCARRCARRRPAAGELIFAVYKGKHNSVDVDGVGSTEETDEDRAKLFVI